MGHYLIFGAHGGIGEATARRLAQNGHSLHLVGRDSKVSTLAGELGASHSIADVTAPSDVVAAAEDAGDDLDGLVYAVGTITLKPFSKLGDDQYETDFAINALGAVRAIRAALPALQNGAGGSILLFSTVAVQQGFSGHASIAMAKGAVEGLTRSLAAELAPKIRVNAIAPSLTDTALAAPMTASEPMAKAIAAMHPLGRLGTAQDHAALAEVLLTESGSWISGQIFGVDGGRSTLRTKG